MKTIVTALMAIIVLGCGASWAQVPDRDIPLGEAVYESYCASCHGQRMPRAPHLSMMRMMTADSVYAALDGGVMKDQAAPLNADEKVAVAEYLTGHALGQADTDPKLPQCEGKSFDFAALPKIRDWGIDLANTRNQSPEETGLSSDAPAKLETAWVVTFPGAIRVRSQPAFAGGFMFIGSQDGTVYALDAKTGCQHWQYRAVSEVRTGISVSLWKGDSPDDPPLAVFGDYLGNIYGVEAETGKLAWKARPHLHPHATISGTPRIHDGLVYAPISSHEDGSAVRPDYPCCTFRGAVAALDERTGETKWITYTIPDEATPRELNSAGTQRWGSSGASIWNTPSIDIKRGQLYVGTGDNYSEPDSGTSDSVIAIGLETGDVRWVYQATAGDIWNGACMNPYRGPNCPENEGPDYDIGASLVLADAGDGRDVLIAGQKSGDVHGIDPDNGTLIWKREIGRGGIQGGVHFGLAAADGVAYVPVSDMVYPGDAGVYTKPPTPGLYALNIADGKLIWSWVAEEDNCEGRRDFCHPGISAPTTVIGDYVFAGALDGWLRVHERSTGKIVWSMDTTQKFTSFNGLKGHGGSINGVGPVAHDGLIYLPSGYGIYDHMPGNVLIVLRERSNKKD